MLLVRGPISDSDHWLDKILERLRGAEVLGFHQVIPMFLKVPDSLNGASRTPNNSLEPTRTRARKRQLLLPLKLPYTGAGWIRVAQLEAVRRPYDDGSDASV